MSRAFAKVVVVAFVAATLPLVLAAPAQASRMKTIRIADASIVEGDSGTQTLSFTLTWSGSKGGAAPSVAYTTAGMTATAGADYTTTSGTVALTNGGCKCATVAVPIQGDGTTEGTETFAVNLSSPVNATIEDAQAIGTIYDNEGPPALVVADISAAEAAGALAFSVLLTNPTSSTVTVDYATADGTALAVTDYTSRIGSLTFSPMQVSKTVTVTVADDALAEDDETVLVNLTNPANASIVDAQGIGSIANDDADPNASVSNASVTEGDSGTTLETFTVTLDAPSGRETLVDYATSDGTALAGADYTATTGTLSIPAGGTQATFDVAVLGDLVYEGNQTLTVTLSGEVNLTVPDGTGVGTITDDDPIPTLSVSAGTAAEGNGGSAAATVTFALSNPSATDVTFDWATADGSATAGADYAAGSGSATILAGETEVTADVQVLGDTTDEPDETLSVTVSDVGGAVAGSGASLTIADDDKTPTTLTAKVAKAAAAVKVKGVLEPATSGLTVTVTLYRKKGAKYVKVATKTVGVKGMKDRDGDGKTDGAYLAKFPRPSKGSYKVTVDFNGSATLAGSSATATFTL